MVRPEDWDRIADFQYPWYDTRYGFDEEPALERVLLSCGMIVDAGSGLGYDAARFARLCPDGQVVGMELTELVAAAHRKFGSIPNLHYIQLAVFGFGGLAGERPARNQSESHGPACNRVRGNTLHRFTPSCSQTPQSDEDSGKFWADGIVPYRPLTQQET